MKAYTILRRKEVRRGVALLPPSAGKGGWHAQLGDTEVPVGDTEVSDYMSDLLTALATCAVGGKRPEYLRGYPKSALLAAYKEVMGEGVKLADVGWDSQAEALTRGCPQGDALVVFDVNAKDDLLVRVGSHLEDITRAEGIEPLAVGISKNRETWVHHMFRLAPGASFVVQKDNGDLAEVVYDGEDLRVNYAEQSNARAV